MFINYRIFISLLLGGLLFLAGMRISGAVTTTAMRIVVGAGLLLLCIPAISFAVYYLHIIDDAVWYIEFRSFDHVEMLGALCGLFFGFVLFGEGKFKGLTPGVLNAGLFLCMLLIIFVPYAKPVIFPIGNDYVFKDQWKDGVCLQTSASTCGPASMATIFGYYGMPKKEEELARSAYSCSRGTENWYLIRYARKQGLDAKCTNAASLDTVEAPAIIGTYIGRVGHFVTYLGMQDGKYVIGDPLKGRLLLTRAEFEQRYRFSGFVMQVKKTDK